MTGLKCLLFLNLFVNAFYDVLSILSRQCGVTQVGMYRTILEIAFSSRYKNFPGFYRGSRYHFERTSLISDYN